MVSSGRRKGLAKTGKRRLDALTPHMRGSPPLLRGNIKRVSIASGPVVRSRRRHGAAKQKSAADCEVIPPLPRSAVRMDAAPGSTTLAHVIFEQMHRGVPSDVAALGLVIE